MDAPQGSFPSPLGVRATNCLLRAKITDWSVLAGWTAVDIGELAGMGPTTVEEILRAMIQEWASFHLGNRPPPNPAGVYDGLVALSAWGTSTRGTRGAVAAITAAAETQEDLPQPVTRAMRALRQIGASEEESRSDFEHAFVELEAVPGFSVFRQRQLEGSVSPTMVELAGEMGLAHTRVAQLEKSFKRKLTRHMQEEDWPIRLAADQLCETLGAVAHSNELDEAFANLDRGHTLELPTHAHRRALLLWLCDYRTEMEWILWPDIEDLTDVILAAVAKRERSELDAATRHLTRLGVRDGIQLRWILSRVGYRIVDDQIVPDG
jgi:hypothetical protein